MPEIVVTMTNAEVDALRREARGATDRADHIPNPTHMDRSKTQYELNYYGLIGEYAVTKVVGLSMSDCGILLCGIRHHGGHPITLPDGRTVQVKSIKLRNPHIVAPFWFALDYPDKTRFVADFGVLTLLANGRVRLLGYTTREHFLAHAEIVDLGSGDRAGIRSDQLFDINGWSALAGAGVP